MLPSLTGLRFYAAFTVVYAHTIASFVSDAQHWLNETAKIAYLGMTLFCVLSGFVIHYNYGATVATLRGAALWSFLVARFARLYPLFLFAFAIDLAFRHYPFDSDDFKAVWPFYITLTQNWFPWELGTRYFSQVYIGLAWSISTEIFLYLIYILLARPLRLVHTDTQTLGIAAILGISATIFFVGHAAGWWLGWVPNQYWWFYLSPICRIPEFLIGVVCADLFLKRIATKPSPAEARVMTWLAPAAILTLIGLATAACVSRRGTFWAVLGDCWGYAPAIAVLVYVLARIKTTTSFLVENKLVVVLLGDASYSMYLLHVYVLWLIAHDMTATGWFAALRVGVSWLLVVLIALGAYRFFEVPARKIIRSTLDLARRKAMLDPVNSKNPIPTTVQ
jgi:peptidoglycan/LPS O-acetylase OafA/YrhL